MERVRSRGRPLSFDRGEALDRVLPVFWLKGYSAASLDELATAAALNRPNLAAAFGDKRGLYLACLERFVLQFTEGAGHAINGPGTLEFCLERFFDFAVSTYGRNGRGCLLFGTAPASSGDDPDIRSVLSRGLQMVESAFRHRLEKSIGRELAKHADVRGLSISLTGVLLMVALHARAGASINELRKMHRSGTSAIIGGALRLRR